MTKEQKMVLVPEEDYKKLLAALAALRTQATSFQNETSQGGK